MAVVGVLGVVGGCGREATPQEVVGRFHQAAAEGRWEEAVGLVDLDAKAGGMFGEIYAKGTPEEKAETQRILGDALEQVTKRDIERHFKSGQGKLTSSKASDTEAQVIQTIGKFSLEYVLRAGDGGWVITDRRVYSGGARPASKAGADAALSKVRGELGREPTLGELNARLPDLISRMRVRTFSVGSGGKLGPVGPAGGSKEQKAE